MHINAAAVAVAHSWFTSTHRGYLGDAMNAVADMAGACPDGHLAMYSGVGFVQARASSLPWFALRVREKLRATTEVYLRGIECEYFAPTTTEVRQWSDRRKVMSVPLFPGYLFCRFNPERQLSILRTPGVIDLVRTGARPSEVDATELAAVKQALSLRKPVDTLPRLVMGQRVRVVYGAMSGVEGVLAMMRSELRLVLAVTMMNRSVAVEIDRAHVVAI